MRCATIRLGTLFLAFLVAAGTCLMAATASAQRSRGQLAPADDLRLDGLVLTHAEGLAVGELLARIGQVTRVRLTATDALADEKVVVLGPARPLRDLMNDLAGLLNAQWSRETGRNPAAYTLLPARGAREREAQLLQATHEGLIGQIDEQARFLVRQPPVEPAGGPGGAGESVAWTARPWLAGTLWLTLAREQRQKLIAEKRLFVPLEPLVMRLPEAVRAELAKAVGHQKLRYDLAWAEAAQHANGLGPPPVFDDPRDPGKGWVHFELRYQGAAPAVVMAIRTRGTGLALDTFRMQLAWLLPPHSNPYTGEPVAGDTPLPSPTAIRQARSQDGWIEQLGQLAEDARIPILADYYRSPPARQVDDPVRGPGVVMGSPIDELDALCSRPGYLWWTRGRTLLFRKRDWYLQRRYEVPDRWMLAVMERLQRQGGRLTYRDVTGLLELTDEQIDGLGRLALLGQSEAELAAGLRPLLGLLNTPLLSPRPVPLSGSISSEELGQLTVRYSQLDASQLRSLALLVAAVDAPQRPAALEDWKLFRTSILRRQPERSLSQNDYRCVVANISWRAGSETAGGYLVSLPLSLPDDRRRNTKVVAPGEPTPNPTGRGDEPTP